MTKSIYIIDLETTGLNDFPDDFPLEIAIYKLNLDNTQEITEVYNTLIGYPEKFKEKINASWWSKQSGIKFKDLQDAPRIQEVYAVMKEILHGQQVLSWNMAYDFGKFIDRMHRSSLYKDFRCKRKIYAIGNINYKRLDCPMEEASHILRIENYYGYKWPTLQEAADYYDVKEPEGEAHRAAYDTHLTTMIVAKMIEKSDYVVVTVVPKEAN